MIELEGRPLEVDEVLERRGIHWRVEAITRKPDHSTSAAAAGEFGRETGAWRVLLRPKGQRPGEWKEQDELVGFRRA